ncbi:YaiI/YqxD family protein [Bacillus horti]|uniref:UPF0178 protein J2S11_003299 n=1 Tax=Caldalkalibacillus horti TaxID=77523 RepID=A0ABT9W2S8_9BACI|nr:YaiI/YqxD family protein [Bacillus horti]MDQ0167374.1 uncharacterized protein YaiI (UPF0178 family) [Bacillus horti]
MKIYVDADACPVKKNIITIAKKEDVHVVLVYSYAHYSPSTATQVNVEHVMVDASEQSTDLYIVNHIKAGDVVITQDYGLAAMVLAKKSYAIHHTGFEYTQDNLDELMLRRYLSAKHRRGGGRVKGPRAFSNEDQQRFENMLLTVIKR